MDGVLVHEGQLIPGADAFLEALRRRGHPFLILTNNSIYSARDLSARLVNLGLDVPGHLPVDLGRGDGGLPEVPTARGHGLRPG